MLESKGLNKAESRLAGVIAGAAVAVAAAWLFAPGMAAAAELTPIASGSAVAPENANVTIDGTIKPGTVSPLTVTNVGGGTWSYGSVYAIIPPKTCYSDYVHNSLYHSSTSVMGDVVDKVFANATYWSETSIGGGAGYTCYAYWGTY
ncbi:lactococcin 972 family bacteriocin [Catenuloplanes indicus]|uniref:Lactococcin 972 family bacteriocin n=1 Tax=Catenuloplanes indicus TaxID=137267 RepID=A0AAE4B2X9_9ACTN|nr:lactococcin 972 family bacteriocin [Catenuloplanes indicus]MDQ0371161.1 hypothetical protein [Catenuloplanes indicus]